MKAGVSAEETRFEYPERRGVSSSARPALYRYATYGLTLASQVEFPELLTAASPATAEVEILATTVPETLEGATFSQAWLQIAPEACQLNIDGVARYRIEQGRRILVDRRVLPTPGPGAEPGDVRLYLLGTALGALLHQRHWLPLHVSALATPSGVWAFTGHSGAGKSTLGAWLHYTRGWPLVSDDVAAIRPDDEQPWLYPGPPRLKLWQDALAALGIDKTGLIRDLTRADKYHLCLHREFRSTPQPLRALVMLERAEEGEAASVELLEGAESVRMVMATIYRPRIGVRFNGYTPLFQACAGLAERIAVYRYRRPWSLQGLETSLAPLLRRIQETS